VTRDKLAKVKDGTVIRTRVKEDNHVGGTKKDDTPQLWPLGHPVLPWASISLTLVFIDKEKIIH
jgi:hypothetical protein